MIEVIGFSRLTALGSMLEAERGQYSEPKYKLSSPLAKCSISCAARRRQKNSEIEQLDEKFKMIDEEMRRLRAAGLRVKRGQRAGTTGRD